jgi:hypothetical protein
VLRSLGQGNNLILSIYDLLFMIHAFAGTGLQIRNECQWSGIEEDLR